MTNIQKGFTLVELMIVVLLIGILSSVGYPLYTDYMAQGKIAEAHAALVDYRSQMEQYFQDNKTYVSAGTTCGVAVASFNASNSNFDLSCIGALETFVATATPKANKGLPAITFTINESNAKATAVSGTSTCATGWAKKKSGTC